jgi:hypothetical protein
MRTRVKCTGQFMDMLEKHDNSNPEAMQVQALGYFYIKVIKSYL